MTSTINPSREQIIALIPSGLPLTIVSALSALFDAALPGGAFGGSTGPGIAASLLTAEGMTIAEAAGHIIAAAELVKEAAPEPVEVSAEELSGALGHLEFPQEGGLVAAVGPTSKADERAREMAKQLIAAFAPYFEENPEAKNYIEYIAWHPETHERWTLTVRRPSGRSPHQLRELAEAERDRLRAALTSVVEEFDQSDHGLTEEVHTALDNARAALASQNHEGRPPQ